MLQTPRAPWTGGHFERMIRTVKQCLSVSLQRRLHSYEELRTLVAEAATVINLRPLSYVGEEEEPLTPSMLLHGRNVTLLPPVYQQDDPDFNSTSTEKQLYQRYKQISDSLRHFEKRWKNEYLLALRDRHKNLLQKQQNHQLEVGDIVILQVDDKHRLDWPLARITKLLPDAQGVVRSVQLFMEGEYYIRPTHRLVPMEISTQSEINTTSNPGRSNKLTTTTGQGGSRVLDDTFFPSLESADPPQSADGETAGLVPF